MHIGIYTPDPHLLGEQAAAVEELIETSCLNLSLHLYSRHGDLIASLTNQPLDVLFYHIEAGGEFENRVWEVRRIIPGCALVLVGDDPRHAVFGYQVRAEDFLLAPLDPEDLISSLAQLLRHRMEAKEQYLPVKVGGVWGPLNMAHILYLESAGHSLIFHMDDGRQFRSIFSFKDYQSLIDLNRHFFRCHKSYVVNLSHVTGLEQNSFTLDNGDTVNISRPYRQITRSYYASYVTGRYDRDGAQTVTARPREEQPL